MKRLAGSEFDEEGAKWFQSPHYKEVKTDMNTEEASQARDPSKRFSNDTEQETKWKRERFYDLYGRVVQSSDFKLDMEELNRNLNIKLEEIPDNAKIMAIFEELNSKSSIISRSKKNWSEHETFLCIWLVMAYCALNDQGYNDLNDKDWDAVGRIFPGKSAEQCKVRWQGILKTNLTKAPWGQEEDRLLVEIIQEKGPKKWKEIACELNKRMETHKTFRQGKQCRERWINHLDPSMNRGAWSAEEDRVLLEAHVQIGKKWAEIAKILKTRTENAVKNRWNSLIKKHRGEFGIDFDTLSTSSANSNVSMDDLEKKISGLILAKKHTSRGRDDGTPHTTIDEQIPEVAEEESPDCYSEFSHETNNTKTEDYRSQKKEDENDIIRFMQKKGGAQQVSSKKKQPSILSTKNSLRDMVTEEMHAHTQNTSFQQQNNQKSTGHDGVFLGQPDKSNENQAQRLYMFDNKPPTNHQEPIISSQGPYNTAPMPLVNQQHPNDPRNGMFNMSNDMLGYNMWRNNLNNLNVLGQNAQQPNVSSNFFGLYNNGNLLQQPNYSLASASLPSESPNPMKFASSYPQGGENENKQQVKPHETNKFESSLENKTFKLADKTLDQLNVSEADQSNFFYAVVDVANGGIYLLDQVTKENYPPPFQTKAKPTMPNMPNMPSMPSMPSMQSMQSMSNIPNANMENPMGIAANSPALNYASWASPPLNANAFLNYPLFNNPLSFGFAKTQFSPNLNLFQGSPQIDTNFFGSTPKMEGRSTEWTPETMNRPILSNLGMKQRLNIANSRGDTPPEVKIGATGGAFWRRLHDKANPPAKPTVEGMKYSSPSSFLQSNQSSHMNRNMI